MVELSRRSLLAAAGAVPLAVLTPALLELAKSDAKAGAGFRFLTKHQAAVIEAAAARLVPGPLDDPLEALAKSPGAREANVIRYIDNLLAAFDSSPPAVFAGGPWSDRHHYPGRDREDYLKKYVPLAERQLVAWTKRIAGLKSEYVAAVKTLDTAANGDFSTASQIMQDQILTSQADVRALIFGHTVEGMYGVPEYGGNAGTVGWKSISWPGDSQPRGYTASEVERSDGADVLDPTGVVSLMMGMLPEAANLMHARGWRFG